MLELFEKLNGVHPLSPELQLHLKAIIKCEEYPKDSFLLKPGRICENICFIQKGLVRVFYENADIEICPWLLREGDIAISVISFFDQKVSDEYIQGLEDTSVYYITYDELMFIYNNFPEFNFVGRVLTTDYYKLKEFRSKSTFGKTAIERYKSLIKFYGDLLPRLSDKCQAAFIGVHPRTFSRIKSKYLQEQS